MTVKAPALNTSGVATGKLREFAMVRLLQDYSGEDGLLSVEVVLPAGAVGTIVHEYLTGDAYAVEFEHPMHALLTLAPAQIAGV